MIIETSLNLKNKNKEELMLLLNESLGVIEKLQKENEEFKYKLKGLECIIETQIQNEEVYESIFEKLEKENKELKKQVKSDVNTIF